MIEIHEDNYSFDVCPRNYRRAILNMLIQLKPKYCLEIGTHLYQTSKVFGYYFEKYEPEGKLITVDIADWKVENPFPKYITEIIVYPYDLDIEKRHGNLEVYYQDWKETVSAWKNKLSEINWLKIYVPMKKLKILPNRFDFAFIDGDHSEYAIKEDLRMAKDMVNDNGYILIDDIEDSGHEQMNYYQNYLKPKNPSFYEMAGMALIKAGDLQL